MAISCDKIFVEGATEKIILSKLGFNENNVEVKFGKEEVIKEFKKYLSSSMSVLKKGNVCFVIDGDEEGYKGVYDRFKKDIKALDYSPPYIKMCKDNLCQVLVVIRDKNNDFKGCIETILLEKLKIDEKINDVIYRVLEYGQQKVGHLSMCD
jgi:predicted ATP-dependent endonuclease of OLD family